MYFLIWFQQQDTVKIRNTNSYGNKVNGSIEKKASLEVNTATLKIAHDNLIRQNKEEEKTGDDDLENVSLIIICIAIQILDSI